MIYFLYITLSAILVLLVARFAFDHKFRTDLVRHSGEASFGTFTAKGAGFIVIVAMLLVALVYLTVLLNNVPVIPSPEIPETEQLVRLYFSHINDGLSGKPDAFARAWDLFTPKYQESKRQKYPRLKFPEEFHKLYDGCGYHAVHYCSAPKNDADPDRASVLVVFSSTESHSMNPFFADFAPPTRKKVSDLKQSSLLDEASITQRIKDAILQDYVVPEHFGWEPLPQIVANTYLNRLIGPRLITETAAVLGVERKRPSAGAGIGDGDYIFDIVEGDKVFLSKLDGEWLIDGIKFSTLGADIRPK